LEREYQTSRMTRDELASRLAQTEGELSVVNEREKTVLTKLRQQQEQEDTLRTERDALLGLRDSLSREREELQQELDRQRNHRNESEAELNRLRDALHQRELAEADARARIEALETRLKALRQNAELPEAPRPNRHGLGADL
jgi:chromosome segregation ATPase